MSALSGDEEQSILDAKDSMSIVEKPHMNYIDFGGVVLPSSSATGTTANQQVVDYLARMEETPLLYPDPLVTAGLIELFTDNADSPFTTLDVFIQALRDQGNANELPYVNGESMAGAMDLLIAGIGT